MNIIKNKKQENLRKKRKHLINGYKIRKKNFLNKKDSPSFSSLQSYIHKLSKNNIFHQNKSNRLISRYSKIILSNE